jgi:2-dehydro-3-deoxygluconokinase
MSKKTNITHRVLCFGELLLRMSPHIDGGWIRENTIPTFVGGAELNVATALAQWNIPCRYVTALPDHALSSDLIGYMKDKGIDTSSVQISGNRIGIYFLPQGSDLKNAGVIYDRAGSSFSELKPGVIDWDKTLDGITWFHFSAINPAINQNVTAVCLEAVKVASKKGITISVDLNYRAKLWKYGKEPVDVMPALAKYCDVIMGNIWAADKLLGIPIDLSILRKNNKKGYLEHALHTSEAIINKFPKVKTVANTFRFDRKGNAIHYYATLHTGHKLYVAKAIDATGIKDKIGSGDCFMAGLIYGFCNKQQPEDIINFSATAAVGKMYETSDATKQTPKKIQALTKKINAFIK